MYYIIVGSNREKNFCIRTLNKKIRTSFSSFFLFFFGDVVNKKYHKSTGFGHIFINEIPGLYHWVNIQDTSQKQTNQVLYNLQHVNNVSMSAKWTGSKWFIFQFDPDQTGVNTP